VVEEPVSTMDVFATVLDYLGVAAPQRESYNLRGKSPDFRVSEWPGENIPNFMVRTRDWKLIMAKNPASRARDALFNLKEDPYEMTNLLGEAGDRAKHRTHAEEMKDRLIWYLDRGGSPLKNSVKERTFA
jgi:arylsulfatase A-like enzyme